MAPLWNSALSKQTAVSFLPAAHMRSHAPAPSCRTRDYPRVAGCPRSTKRAGQLAKGPPLLLKAQPTFAGWGPSPSLAPWVPRHPWIHCSEGFAPYRPVGRDLGAADAWVQVTAGAQLAPHAQPGGRALMSLAVWRMAVTLWRIKD